MHLGLAIPLLASPHARFPVPRWPEILERTALAEDIGLDLVVVEDVLAWPTPEFVAGAWESVAILGALASRTSTIRLGHSVVNAPYRPPGMIASMAVTLQEISGGRYVLGLGAGNSPDTDYAAFGIPADHRFSRVSETARIVRSLLHDGHASLDGRFHRVEDAHLALHEVPDHPPPLVLGAGGPRMKRLAAEVADEWNWWTPAGDQGEVAGHLEDLDRACEEVGRDPATLRRSLDAYLPLDEDDGSVDRTVQLIGELEEQGIAELRFYQSRRPTNQETMEAVEALGPIVSQVRAGREAAARR